jgi:hypothetical protein
MSMRAFSIQHSAFSLVPSPEKTNDLTRQSRIKSKFFLPLPRWGRGTLTVRVARNRVGVVLSFIRRKNLNAECRMLNAFAEVA